MLLSFTPYAVQLLAKNNINHCVSAVLLTRPANLGGDGTVLDVDAREVKVLVGVGVARAGQLQHTEMPIRAVGRGRDGNRRNDLLQGLSALGVPEADLVGAEVLLGQNRSQHLSIRVTVAQNVLTIS